MAGDSEPQADVAPAAAPVGGAAKSEAAASFAAASAASDGQEAVPLPPPAPQASPPLFSLAELLGEVTPSIGPLPRVRIVDAGSMLLGESEDVWRPLVHRGLCESVVGFEPNAEECSVLNADEARREAEGGSPCSMRFLPWALGDGQPGEFRLCSAPMTSSMLEPNIPLLRRFVQLEEVTTVSKRIGMQTKRLDDLLPELPGGRCDYLKLDVQGYELAVLKGAEDVLKTVLVLHSEVEFVEMYEKQPLFADVDQFLRARGFVFHRFASVHGRPMKPIYYASNPLQPISQQLWADAVYIRDLWELRDHSPEELLKTALVLHEVYHSYDVVHHVLQKYDPAVAKVYFDKVLGFGRAS